MQEFETIYSWTAKRAGGRITIYGKTREGNPRRLVGVDFIELNSNRASGEIDNRVRAQDKDGVNYWLSTGL